MKDKQYLYDFKSNQHTKEYKNTNIYEKYDEKIVIERYYLSFWEKFSIIYDNYRK